MSEPKPSRVPLQGPIAAAVEKYNTASMRRMSTDNAADEPTEPLFHYTGEAALYSIIESEALWFTSIYCMDDTEELTFGFADQFALELGEGHKDVQSHATHRVLGIEGLCDRNECHAVAFEQLDQIRESRSIL